MVGKRGSKKELSGKHGDWKKLETFRSTIPFSFSDRRCPPSVPWWRNTTMRRHPPPTFSLVLTLSGSLSAYSLSLSKLSWSHSLSQSSLSLSMSPPSHSLISLCLCLIHTANEPSIFIQDFRKIDVAVDVGTIFSSLACTLGIVPIWPLIVMELDCWI